MNDVSVNDKNSHREEGPSCPLGHWVSLLLLMAGVLVLISTFEREIDEFNAMARTFIVSGNFKSRQFDEYGMPVTYTARMPDGFKSPYYIIHYGLIYSDVARPKDNASPMIWFHDPSIIFWDVPPPKSHVTRKNFLAAADWVVNNLKIHQGQAHLLYDFDWTYPGLESGKLSKPWWSGLTDGYALLLLLRAADVTGEKRYLAAADVLYQSVLARVEDGGSLLILDNNTVWIEEYVVMGLPASKQPRVLNGMIYAFLGVRAYESMRPEKSQIIAPELLDSIRQNLPAFDMGWWVAYDMLNNPTNIKYYEVTLGQLGLLYEISGDHAYNVTREKWEEYQSWWLPLSVKWLLHGRFSFSALNLILEILFFWTLIALYYWKILRHR